jgi:predicted DNA-binding transcriptional regulator YafY
MTLQQPLEQAFAKITQHLDNREMLLLEKLHQSFSIWVFPSEMPDLRLMELATHAAANQQAMRFTYRKAGARDSEVRTVHPYHVDAFDGRVYLQAFDPSRGAERKFVIDRMSDAALTGEAFERPKDFDPQKAFDSALAIMSGQGDYRVVVELDPWLTDILRRRRLHASQHVAELASGGAHLTLRLSSLDLIEQTVLSWGTHATVLQPQELRDRLYRTTAELQQRYAPSVPCTEVVAHPVHNSQPDLQLTDHAN